MHQVKLGYGEKKYVINGKVLTFWESKKEGEKTQSKLSIKRVFCSLQYLWRDWLSPDDLQTNCQAVRFL